MGRVFGLLSHMCVQHMSKCSERFLSRKIYRESEKTQGYSVEVK